MTSRASSSKFITVGFILNGESVASEVRPDQTLLDMLREQWELMSVRQACGIGLLHVEGIEVSTMVTHLWEKHRIITTPITHAEFNGVRITPNVYTSPDEIDVFCDVILAALRTLSS
jgi:selenocysteine lyase/cysteine desulfurase